MQKQKLFPGYLDSEGTGHFLGHTRMHNGPESRKRGHIIWEEDAINIDYRLDSGEGFLTLCCP